jgi:hypothetical protein
MAETKHEGFLIDAEQEKDGWRALVRCPDHVPVRVGDKRHDIWRIPEFRDTKEKAIELARNTSTLASGLAHCPAKPCGGGQ